MYDKIKVEEYSSTIKTRNGNKYNYNSYRVRIYKPNRKYSYRFFPYTHEGLKEAIAQAKVSNEIFTKVFDQKKSSLQGNRRSIYYNKGLLRGIYLLENKNMNPSIIVEIEALPKGWKKVKRSINVRNKEELISIIDKQISYLISGMRWDKDNSEVIERSNKTKEYLINRYNEYLNK